MENNDNDRILIGSYPFLVFNENEPIVEDTLEHLINLLDSDISETSMSFGKFCIYPRKSLVKITTTYKNTIKYSTISKRTTRQIKKAVRKYIRSTLSYNIEVDEVDGKIQITTHIDVREGN